MTIGTNLPAPTLVLTVEHQKRKKVLFNHTLPEATLCPKSGVERY
jgi:hypothetical protein